MKMIVKYFSVTVLLSIVIILITVFVLRDELAAAPEEVTVHKAMIIHEAAIPEPTYLLTYEVKEKITYLGEFKLTAYCSCSKCCGKWAENRPVDANGQEIVIGSTGNVLTANHSIAVDPEVIPYGTVVVINGNEYVAEDCGGAIKDNRIDVYFNDHDEALQFGVQIADVYIKEVFE